MIPHVPVLLLLFPSFAAASSSFTYNNDFECSFPFSAFTISNMECSASNYISVDGLTDEDGQGGNNNNNNAGGTCSFGDHMVVEGSVTVDSMVSRDFSVSLKVCFSGSNSFYKPQQCSTYTTHLDLGYQRAQYQQQQRYYGYYGNNRDGEQDDNSLLLNAGTYDFEFGVQIPEKNVYFTTGTYF